ncbi:MAG: hypothetical protein ABI947_03075 [Chloroflexota bacterium]
MLDGDSAINTIEVCGHMPDDTLASAYIKAGDQYTINGDITLSANANYCYSGDAISFSAAGANTVDVILDTHPNITLTITSILVTGTGIDPFQAYWSHPFNFVNNGPQGWIGLDGVSYDGANHDWESVDTGLGYWRNHISRDFVLDGDSAINTIEVCGYMADDTLATAYIGAGDQYANNGDIALPPNEDFCYPGNPLSFSGAGTNIVDVTLDTHPNIILTITSVIVTGTGIDPFPPRWSHPFDFVANQDPLGWVGLDGITFNANDDWESVDTGLGYWRNHISHQFQLDADSTINTIEVCGHMSDDTLATAYIGAGDQYTNFGNIALPPNADFCYAGNAISFSGTDAATIGVILDTHPNVVLTITSVTVSGIGNDPFNLICQQGDANGARKLLVPCQVETPTATPTLVPTTEPFAVYHVKCNLSIPAKARSFPSLDGQTIRTFPQGTTLFVFESHLDRDGNEWRRVTGYDEFDSRTLWIREDVLDNGDASPSATGCNTLTPAVPYTPIPPTAITPYPTSTISTGLVPVSPGCKTGNDCPLQTGSPSNQDIVAFVLACESGNNSSDANDIAYVIRNRSKSATYAGIIVNVVKESGQWQCYMEGAAPSANLSNLSNINSDIVTIANDLLNYQPLPAPSVPGIDKYGLYTYGAGPYTTADRDQTTDSTIIANLTIDHNGPCHLSEGRLTSIYIYRRHFGDSLYTTVFFSDDPGCHYNP